MTGVRAVCFDAYGTLCRIVDRRGPYRRLFERIGVDRGAAAHAAMTTDYKFEALAEVLSPPYGAGCSLADLSLDLAAELASVELFDEVPAVMSALAGMGLKTWVASNLATPYTGPLQAQLATFVDGFSLSFQVGVIKPDSAIYAHVRAGLGLSAEQIVMVGDSRRADVEGARSAGMKAVLLSRGRASRWPEQVATLTELVQRLADGKTSDSGRVLR